MHNKKINLSTAILLLFFFASTAQAALSPIKSTFVINTFTANGPVINNEDYYGYGAGEIGDFDGDGITDIAVGAWGSDINGTNRGAVHISFLNADGSLKSTTEINDLTANGPVLNDSDNYGISVASLGDLDGDGVTDIIVGTWADDAGGFNRGGVHIHFLNTDASVKSTVEINSLTPNGPVLANSDIYGVDVASMGDFDGDGVTDIIVGAFLDDSGGLNRGAAYISLLNADGSVKSTKKISSLTPNGPVLANGSGYGRGVTSLGDLDGDGITDIAVGAETDSTGGPNRGAVHISFLNADASVKSTVKISSLTSNGPGALLSDGDRYGVKTMNLGDLDGDGVVDLGVGSYVDDADDTGLVDCGSFYIHFLNTDGSVKSTVKINRDPLTPNGPVLGNVDYYGTSILNLGDMDGDGVPEIAVGAGGNDTGGSNRGTLHIHFTNSFVTPPAPTVITPPASSTVYNNQTPTFTGTGSREGNIITIMDGLTLIGTGTIASDNTWSITSGPTLAYGSYNFTIYESSVFDGPSILHTITIASDIVPPANPALAPDLQAASDTGLYDNDDETSQTLPTLDVVCTEIGSTINLYSDNPAPNTLIGTHTCIAVGTTGASVSLALADGTHNITYAEEDPAGNESGHSPALAITIDTLPPGPVAVVSVGGDISLPYATNDTTPEIIITSVTGDTVAIPGFTCVPVPATSTSVSCTANAAYPIPSNQTVTASIIDLAGNGPTTGNISFSVQNPSPAQPIAGGRPAPLLIPDEKYDEKYDEFSCLTEKAAGYSFADIESHFAKDAILLLSKMMSTNTPITQGYLGANKERLYKPDGYITRAEFLKMTQLSNCEEISQWNNGDTTPRKIFPDVPIESNAWYNNYIYSALEAGIIDGYEDGNFYPDNYITRAEASKILINIKKLAGENYTGSKYFEDVNENEWFYKFVSAGKENMLIYGYEDGTFKPYNNISRGETALMIVRIFDLKN